MSMEDDLTQGERLLLALLYAQGRAKKLGEPIYGRVTLAKLLFLLSKNPLMQKRLAEVQFEPYDYGPWSDWVDVALDELSSRGLISQKAGQVTRIGTTTGGMKEAKRAFDGLSQEERGILEDLKTNFASLSTDQLLERVYAAYPEYATESKWAGRKDSRK